MANRHSPFHPCGGLLIDQAGCALGPVAQRRGMEYDRFVRLGSWSITSAAIFLVAGVSTARADVVEMRNGDRFSGTVISLSSNAVVLESALLGRVKLPRAEVAMLMVETNGTGLRDAASNRLRPAAGPNPPAAGSPASIARGDTNVDLSAALRQLGSNTNFIGQIRQQMVAGQPAAAAKYDQMVDDLMSGRMDLNDLRREAKTYADQLRELKRELGPEADDSLDAYLSVLDGFLKETTPAPGAAAPPGKSSPTP